MKDKPEIERFMSVKTAAESLDCTDQYIYQLLSTGTLTGIRIGVRAIRISASSINTFIEGNRINPEDYRINAMEEEVDPEPRLRQTGFGEKKVARSNWMSLDRIKG